MLLENSTGIDLNRAGVDLQGVDILWDIPQVLTIARVRFKNGTRIEFAYCQRNAEPEDVELGRALIPPTSAPLRGWHSDTLGCGHGDEYTTAYWVFE
jgi:hypothetical protein